MRKLKVGQSSVITNGALKGDGNVKLKKKRGRGFTLWQLPLQFVRILLPISKLTLCGRLVSGRECRPLAKGNE